MLCTMRSLIYRAISHSDHVLEIVHLSFSFFAKLFKITERTVVTPRATLAGVAFLLSQKETQEIITMSPDGM